MTTNIYGKKIKDEVDRIYDLCMYSRNELVRAWLIARGWDGKDIEQAKELAKGYKITQQIKDGTITFSIEKMTEAEQEASDRGEVYFYTL